MNRRSSAEPRPPTDPWSNSNRQPASQQGDTEKRNVCCRRESLPCRFYRASHRDRWRLAGMMSRDRRRTSRETGIEARTISNNNNHNNNNGNNKKSSFVACIYSQEAAYYLLRGIVERYRWRKIPWTRTNETIIRDEQQQRPTRTGRVARRRGVRASLNVN